MLSLYIHIPFCQRKCNYCSFTSFPMGGLKDFGLRITDYLDALEKEIDFYKEQLGDQEIKSIYFGGGTPTLIGAEGIIHIVEKIKQTWNIESLSELSLECNPYPHEQIFDVIEKLNAQYRTISRLRFSFGIQSMNDEVLTWAGRPYNFLALTDFLRGLRERKQENNVFNFDFIAFGSFQNKKDGTHELWRPYQREFFDTFVHSKFSESFSIYMLERHGGTPRDLAKTHLPDDENILEEFSLLKNILLKNDYKRYEVSNFCRSGSASIHNMVYWNMENYLGLGVTASSFLVQNAE